MIPIHELLSRIRWDEDFGRGEFAIGYQDRFERETVVVSLRDVYFDDEDRFSVQVIDSEGQVHAVPLHRIREVYKDGRLIWQRSVESGKVR